MTVPHITPHTPSHTSSSSSSSSATGGAAMTSHPNSPGSNTNTNNSNSSSSSSSSRLSLEWLRGCCVEDVRHFFTGALGLGRKSVGCVSLLTLRMRDFPVDVNVGRICARLGWIPLQVGVLFFVVVGGGGGRTLLVAVAVCIDTGSGGGGVEEECKGSTQCCRSEKCG
jgi:hypothetical protein